MKRILQFLLILASCFLSSCLAMSIILEEVSQGTRSIAESMDGQDSANKSALERLRQTLDVNRDTERITAELERETKSLLAGLDELADDSRASIAAIETTRARNDEEKAAIELVDRLANESARLAAASESLISEFKS
jgi:hypothetical protein